MDDDFVGTLLYIRMKCLAATHERQSTASQRRSLGMHISRFVDLWDNGERKILKTKMRHKILSAILGRPVTSQYQMSFYEHSVILDVVSMEESNKNGTIYIAAQCIEKYIDTKPEKIFGDAWNTRVPDL